MVDTRVAELKDPEVWLEDSVLAPQRCRLFLMARFPHLTRPFSDDALSGELSRGEERLGRLRYAGRLLRGLNRTQRKQLVGLLLDIEEALKYYASYSRSSQSVSKLAAESPRRARMLFRKTKAARLGLEDLRAYAADLDPSLGLDHTRAADRCLRVLANLREEHSAGEYFSMQKSEYSALKNPKQLGVVQLYWFFHSECKRSGPESEVRVAMVVNGFLATLIGRALKYVARYRIDRSKGSSAVRQAVMRFQPRTIE
jgi:hypothetical protein